jgi:hypothetical protein
MDMRIFAYAIIAKSAGRGYHFLTASLNPLAIERFEPRGGYFHMLESAKLLYLEVQPNAT